MRKEKTYNLLFFALIFIVILSVVLLNPLNNLDELWNYNFARNIADGLVPYKDFNMLQMPLLPIICGIILKLTFNELIIMRILASLLCSVIIYITYKLFNILNIKKEISIILSFGIIALFTEVFCIDYNYATLLIVLLIIYKEIKTYKKDNVFFKTNWKSELFLGILAGLTVTLKQTTGIFVCAALLGNKLLFVKKKEELKAYFKAFVYRLIGIVLPICVMIIYLLVNNAFSEFISYTIKGVSGFSNYISYINLVDWNVVGILSVLIPLTLIYEWIKSIIFEKDKISYIFLVYGLAMFVVCFPISDKIHFLIGALPTIIVILYEFHNLLNKICKKIFKNKMINDIILTFLVTFTILFSIDYTAVNLYKYWSNMDNTSNLNHYKYIMISEKLEKQIEEVDKYIVLNDNVKILDASAATYMIPIDRYNKNYDMLLKGNLGFNGEDKLIQEISNSRNTRYLILKDKFNKNWQTPLDIIDYVKENKTKIGEIEIFDVYE